MRLTKESLRQLLEMPPTVDIQLLRVAIMAARLIDENERAYRGRQGESK